MRTNTDNENGGEFQGVDTLVERAAAMIHRDILNGKLPPDFKLGIHELAKRYATGPTPIREALSRLSPLGFVEANANRGFRVRAVSRADLNDIAGTRLVVEIQALRRSIALGDDEWEASIMAALHRFQKIVDREPQALWRSIFDYDRVHKQLHLAMISACGLPRLVEMCETLYDATCRYRCIALAQADRGFPLHLNEVHTRLAQLVIRREADAACEELSRQIKATLVSCYPAGDSPQ